MAFILHTRILDDMEEDCVFDMGGQCNYIDHSNDFFCAFMHKDRETGMEKLLMLVPRETILYVERVERGDSND